MDSDGAQHSRQSSQHPLGGLKQLVRCDSQCEDDEVNSEDSFDLHSFDHHHQHHRYGSPSSLSSSSTSVAPPGVGVCSVGAQQQQQQQQQQASSMAPPPPTAASAAGVAPHHRQYLRQQWYRKNNYLSRMRRSPSTNTPNPGVLGSTSCCSIASSCGSTGSGSSGILSSSASSSSSSCSSSSSSSSSSCSSSSSGVFSTNSNSLCSSQSFASSISSSMSFATFSSMSAESYDMNDTPTMGNGVQQQQQQPLKTITGSQHICTKNLIIDRSSPSPQDLVNASLASSLSSPSIAAANSSNALRIIRRYSFKNKPIGAGQSGLANPSLLSSSHLHSYRPYSRGCINSSSQVRRNSSIQNLNLGAKKQHFIQELPENFKFFHTGTTSTMRTSASSGAINSQRDKENLKASFSFTNRTSPSFIASTTQTTNNNNNNSLFQQQQQQQQQQQTLQYHSTNSHHHTPAIPCGSGQSPGVGVSGVPTSLTRSKSLDDLNILNTVPTNSSESQQQNSGPTFQDVQPQQHPFTHSHPPMSHSQQHHTHHSQLQQQQQQQQTDQLQFQNRGFIQFPQFQQHQQQQQQQQQQQRTHSSQEIFDHYQYRQHQQQQYQHLTSNNQQQQPLPLTLPQNIQSSISAQIAHATSSCDIESVLNKISSLQV